MSDPAKTESAPTGVIEEFRSEFAVAWQALPNKDLFFGLLMAWLLVFQFLGNATLGYINTPSLLEWMYQTYTNKNSEESHGLLIPFVVLILFWLKRKELLAARLRTWWLGLILLAGSMALHVLAYVVQQPKLSIVAMLGGIWGLMGLAWGPQFLRRSFFPFCFLVFLVPMSKLDFMQGFTFYLRLLSAKLSVFMGGTILGINVVGKGVDFSVNGQPPLSVAPACSGIHSLIALLALTTIFGVLVFQKAWKRAAVALLAVPLAILGNVLRLTIVIVVASISGQKQALNIETNLGYLTFIVALAVLMVAARYLGDPGSGSISLREKGGFVNTRKVGLAIVALAIMAVGVGGLLGLRSHQKLGPPGVKTRPLPNSRNLLVELPIIVPGYWGEPKEQLKSTIETLPPDTSFGCVLYTNLLDGFPICINVVLMGTDRTSIHKPEYCLTGGGWNIESQETVAIPIERPVPYDLQVKKFTATGMFPQNGRLVTVRRLYVFWFVAGDRLSADHGSRMWAMAKEILRSGVLQRWAYVAVQADCLPGQEAATFERMKKFIVQTVPQFQLVPAPASERADAGAPR